MIEVKSQWKGVTDKEKWATRGASFVAKAKTTKLVWFPPKPVETGEKAASTAKKTKKRTRRGAAGAAKKRATGAKKATRPVRRNKT
jgi:hypothetical protein